MTTKRLSRRAENDSRACFHDGFGSHDPFSLDFLLEEGRSQVRDIKLIPERNLLRSEAKRKLGLWPGQTPWNTNKSRRSRHEKTREPCAKARKIRQFEGKVRTGFIHV